MHSALAKAIRDARAAVGLTQRQLGMRVGLKGRAVYRWECADSVPRHRHRRALVAAVRAIDPQVAAELQGALESYQRAKKGLMVAPADATPMPAVPLRPTGALALELALFGMADELDLPPRRLRLAVAKLLARIVEAGFSIDSARQHIELGIAHAQNAAAAEQR